MAATNSGPAPCRPPKPGRSAPMRSLSVNAPVLYVYRYISQDHRNGQHREPKQHHLLMPARAQPMPPYTAHPPPAGPLSPADQPPSVDYRSPFFFLEYDFINRFSFILAKIVEMANMHRELKQHQLLMPARPCSWPPQTAGPPPVGPPSPADQLQCVDYR